jgi:hypothetical protein
MKNLNKSRLAQQCSGVDDPSLMGTTGLVAWVLHGLPGLKHPRNRWERFLVAAQIIRGRKMSLDLFVDAIISTAHHGYGINLRRFYQATRPLVTTARLRPECYQW